MSVEEMTGHVENVRVKRIKKSCRKKKPKQKTERAREGNLLSHYLGIRSFVCGGSADDDDPEDWD